MNDFSEVVNITRKLIQYDTSNDGREIIETPAAQYVMDLLYEVGYEPQWSEPIHGRPSVFLRIPGQDSHRPALVVHGHLDVVPAVTEDWSVDPFGAEIIDGMIYGRGAVDMKNMDAMIITVIRDMARTGWRPNRDLIVAFFADEEAGGLVGGAQWYAHNKPELFAGASEAISEVGGYNTYVANQSVYLLQTGEKSIHWYSLTATGQAGHGSQVNDDNAVLKMASALASVGAEKWPTIITPTLDKLLKGVSEITGLPYDPRDKKSIDALISELGPAQRYVGATTSTRANPTYLSGGYSVNVIPQQATGGIDVRAIPGTESEVKARIADLVGDMDMTMLFDENGIEAPFSGTTVAAMIDALRQEDPGAHVLPYLLSAGTDNKALSRLGINGYGFAPLKLPQGFDFPAKFHGVDECVPIESLEFGVRVLRRFLQTC